MWYACLTARREHGMSAAALMAVARAFSPRVMAAGDGCVLVDVSGLGRLIGAPPVIAAELRQAAGGAAIVAVAPTQTAARLLAASAAAGGAIDEASPIVTDDPAAALACLPVAVLGAVMLNADDLAHVFQTLGRWGITTLGELAALPAAPLTSRLGRRGAVWQRLARGVDPRPFVPDADVPRYCERLELEWPIDGLEPLSFVLARLLEPLAAALERADRGAAAVRLELRLVDRSTHARLLQLPAAMRDARVLRTLLLLDLESHPAPAAIDVVAVEIDPAPARITQFSLLERARPLPETVSTLMARLTALVGETRCGAVALVDSHRPGAFAGRPFTGDAPPPPAGRVSADRGPSISLRRRRPPPAVRVRVERGRPVHVAGARRGQPSGAVVEASGPWRTSGDWWQPRSRVAPNPAESTWREGWNRDEWDVALAGGWLGRIFRDRDTGTWFLDGEFD